MAMSRREFVKGGLAALGFLALPGGLFAAPPGWKPKKKPDLVFGVLSDTHLMVEELGTILDDIKGHMPTTSIKTLDSYLNALRRIFVVEDEPAWMPSIRSKTAIRTSHKRQLADPSIATAVLGIKPEKLMRDFNLFGFLFESLCVRDMRVYAQANDGEVFHYRDSSGQEVDMIVSLRDGRWGAVEVKLGGGQIDEAASNLLALKDKVDKDSMGAPAFLVVLTGTEFAYRRTDGVFVVPLGCLVN